MDRLEVVGLLEHREHRVKQDQLAQREVQGFKVQGVLPVQLEY